jgi:hypothetical protein
LSFLAFLRVFFWGYVKTTLLKVCAEKAPKSPAKTPHFQDYFSTLSALFQGLFLFLYSLLTNLPFSVIIIMCENMRECDRLMRERKCASATA